MLGKTPFAPLFHHVDEREPCNKWFFYTKLYGWLYSNFSSKHAGRWIGEQERRMTVWCGCVERSGRWDIIEERWEFFARFLKLRRVLFMNSSWKTRNECSLDWYGNLKNFKIVYFLHSSRREMMLTCFLVYIAKWIYVLMNVYHIKIPEYYTVCKCVRISGYWLKIAPLLIYCSINLYWKNIMSTLRQ